MKHPIQNQFYERVILLFIAGLFLLCSPARIFWAAKEMPWFAPYFIWLLLITLTWLLYRWLRSHGIKDHEL
ncbi:MAG: hypothetical protein KZQ64_00055 [gamma proteobacterium symbiont of Bathyaustriella thionipta]|nr:hypothetical protein [gamma proteobacterium symbiont of Bathyaustriella thionipta]MCU7950899.1 hypothetical protein [gamma proteobacterium symbiont of Bathyaustriella thionipta]MCU7951803.1 hypothetical protein [gamma proteobacterium symbiont of Bathyaustriella thionipta]MCU7957391.1 hypothetical protein [gamma proteobacterium symbiont of Bathyaustriella thionipta]MCU7966026.1 hypothetical protein [gamma proteobacterium symbiont of Bathyaustriella thionipta]